MSACTCGFNVCAYCRREIANEFGTEAARKFQPDAEPTQTLAEVDAEDAKWEAQQQRKLEQAEVDQ